MFFAKLIERDEYFSEEAIQYRDVLFTLFIII